MRPILIVNPVAGNGYALSIAEKVSGILKEEFHTECAIMKTEYPGHAEELARRAAKDPEAGIVFAVGGDGTVSEAVRGITGTGKAFGIIPAGTGNDFIKCVHLPKDPEEALRFAMTHEPRDIDAGVVNGTCFANIIGTGFDVLTLDYAARHKEKMQGMLPYFLGLIQAIFHSRGHHLKISVDGKTQEGDYLLVTAANGIYLGGGFPVNPTALPDDGKLDVVIIRSVPRWKLLFYLFGLVNGAHLKYRITTHLQAEQVILEGTDMRVEVDGLVMPMNRADIGLKKGGLRLICPEREQNS